MRYYFISILLFSGLVAMAQNKIVTGDTVFNQTDKQGLKQGYWKVKYPSGVLKYSACYKDNKPVGLMKRYFDDNTLMAELEFPVTGTRIKAKLYYQAGPLAAEGIYSQKDIKDSVWNYYSYYTRKLKSRETFLNGKKHGITYNYYEDGTVAEERGWKNGVMHGFWKQFYSNSNPRFVCNYIEGKRDGNYTVYYPDNKAEWVGNYVDDKRQGKWIHYDVNGSIQSEIEYKDGVALNADELQAKEQKMLDDIEKQKGKIAEPDETNFVPTPGSK